MRDITFTTTATNRPAILRRTYASFSESITDINLRNTKLLINIDPLPSRDKIADNIAVAEEFFGDVQARTPAEPNFSGAINWLWSEANTPYIFHLEDDWILIEPIKIKPLIVNMKDRLQIILRAYGYRYDKMVLSPSIIKRELYSAIGGKLDVKLNPEIQLRNPAIAGFKINRSMVLDFPHDRSKIIVKDIGRKWMARQKFKRPDKKSNFFKWVKK